MKKLSPSLFALATIASLTLCKSQSPHTNVPGLVSFSRDGGAIFRGPIQSTSGSSSFDTIKVEKNILISNGKLTGKSAQVDIMEAKEIISKNRMKVQGVLNVTGEMEAKGRLTARSISGDSVSVRTIHTKHLEIAEKMISKGTLRAEEGDFGKELKTNDLVVKGTIRCTGRESLVTMGSVQMKGVDAVAITTRTLQVNDTLSTSGVTVTGKGNRKARLDVVNGTIRADDMISTGLMSSKMVKSETGDVRGLLQARNLTVTMFGKFRQLNSTEAHVRSLTADLMDVKKRLQVSGGAIVAMNGIQSKADCKVEGTLVSEKGRFREELVVTGVLSANNIVANKNITSKDSLVSRSIDVKRGHLENAKVDTLVSDKITAGSMVVNQSFTSTGEFKAINNATVYGKLIADGTLFVTSTIQSEENIHAKGDLRSGNDIIAGGNATIKKNVNCHGTIQSPFVTVTNTLHSRNVHVEDMNISRMLISSKARFGSGEGGEGAIIIDSNGMKIMSDLEGKNASFDGNVNAVTMNTSSVNVDETITTKHFISRTIAVQHAEIDGNMTTHGILEAAGISASNIGCNNMVVQDVHIATGKVDKAIISALAVESVDISGNITVAKGSAINSEIVNADRFYAKDIEAQDGVKATSFIGKRVYTEDITSNGYITAQNLNVKEELMVRGEFTAEGVITAKTSMNTKDAKIENRLEAATASFGGFVEAGGMQVRKLKVSGELSLGDINIGRELNKIKELEEKIDKLEALVSKLSST